MAIIPSIPGVQAHVKVNGKQVKEYADSSECHEDDSMVRYIEAVSGARFTIHCKVWHPYDLQGQDIRARVWVDGKRIKGCVITHDEHEERQGEMNVKGVKSFKDGKGTIAPMAFSELDIDENHKDIPSRKLHEKVTSVGTIRIEIERGQAKVKARRDRTTTMDEIGKISEKALKGKSLSHQVKLQASEPAAYSDVYSFVPDSEGEIATFVFRYRSKSALQAEGIIPRTPSPTPLEERPLEELKPEELRELLRRHRERDAAASAVKREFKTEDTGDDSRTGMDHAQSDLEITTVRRIKRPRISGSVETIDLTDD
ncbi:uncharacterized protein LTHEOB_8898 [Lasiodiplodia theobromae]|nr:uncharacterized protein LTHEOB_8898 [Lasiodiplodia theobromae]KAF4541096.1 hypothetical protein LTHEOB_8898 [Lasiodiplodia theobromae]